MPHLTQSLSFGSPIVDLFVGVSNARRAALQQANQPIPQFQVARALIDTGASGTCIDPSILQPLNLTPTGTVNIQTPSTGGTSHQCLQYDVALGIYHPANPMMLLTTPVIATQLSAQGIDALIGRDVLAQCLLIYDGVAATMTLAF